MKFNLDSVRMERSDDETSQAWRVLAGSKNNPTLLGFVRRDPLGRGGRAWIATTPELLRIPGAWPTRHDALRNLIEHVTR